MCKKATLGGNFIQMTVCTDNDIITLKIQDGMVKKLKRTPVWLKCFFLCLFGVVVSTLVLSVVTFFRIYKDKEYIIETNAKNISKYVDMNVVEKLSMIEDRFCGTNVAENMWKAASSADIRLQLHSLMADTTDVLGLYFIDYNGNNYAVGDVSGDLSSRKELMNNAMESDAYKDRGRNWFYLKTSRGYNACVLFADVVYFDDSFNKNVLGKMLLYVDADKMNKSYVDKAAGEEAGIVILDSAGNIVFSTKSEWHGNNFYENFEEAKSRFSDYNGMNYVYSSYKSDISGWKNVVYFNADIIRGQAYALFALILIAAVLCLIVVLGLAYYISARIGKPIDELFKHIKVSSAGNIILPDDFADSETDEIKSIFNTVIEKLKQQMDERYLNEIELKNLQIKSYESQINPHFIFNTLQIIQMLSVLGETDRVNEIVTCLGDMMRFNLNKASTVKLIEEVEVVENYFKILKYRYQDNFDYKIIIDEDLHDCEVLKFTIQPFVENSVKHGFANKKGLWEIVVMAKKMNDEVVFIIRDNGVGIPEEKLCEIKRMLAGETELRNEGGIGICNVHNRIRLLFGAQYGVEIYCGNSTQVVVHMPYMKKNNEEGESNV